MLVIPTNYVSFSLDLVFCSINFGFCIRCLPFRHFPPLFPLRNAVSSFSQFLLYRFDFVLPMSNLDFSLIKLLSHFISNLYRATSVFMNTLFNP